MVFVWNPVDFKIALRILHYAIRGELSCTTMYMEYAPQWPTWKALHTAILHGELSTRPYAENTHSFPMILMVALQLRRAPSEFLWFSCNSYGVPLRCFGFVWNPITFLWCLPLQSEFPWFPLNFDGYVLNLNWNLNCIWMVSEFVWIPRNSYGTFPQQHWDSYKLLCFLFLEFFWLSYATHSFPMIAMVTLRNLNPALRENYPP